MSKDLNIIMHLDFYGEVLTEKQRDVIELYYNEDLSLAEIAQNLGITRQGVRDSIKRGEAVLLDMEQKLGLLARFNELKAQLEDITGLVRQIGEINSKFSRSLDIAERIEKILKITDDISL